MKPHGIEPDAEEGLAEELARLRVENAKLRTIRDALIGQVDRNNDLSGRAFSLVKPILEVEGNVEKRIQRLARAMSEAKIARRQLQQAIDAIGEGFILYDQDDRIVLCNRKYRQIFPELEHLLTPGTHFRDIIQYAAEIGVIVESVTDPQAWIASRVSSHRQSHCQFQQLLSDGRWIQISEQATDEGGKVTIVSDITPFKRLEEARRLTSMAERSDVLAKTVASIAQGVIVFGDDLKLVTWNSQAAMLLNLPYVDIHSGIDVMELFRLIFSHGAQVPRSRRREVRDWIGTDKRPPLRIEIAYPGGRIISANFRDMPADGFVVTMTDVSAQFQAARMLERSKEVLEQRVQERTRELTRLNEILQDEIRRHEATATDLQHMRKRAEEANLSKTQFLAAASHDLLQPLNAARLYLFALETSPLVEPGAHQLLDNISQSLQSTESILSTLLDISKLDAGGYRPKPAGVVIQEVFDRLKVEFGPLAAQKGLRLRIAPSTAIAWSDDRLLRRIVQNFLSNAIKYTERGTILLGARRRGGQLVIEIHDTGPGIAEEDRELIFREFQRAPQRGGEVGGLGLGLAIARRAADLLGHRITLRSVPGQGSCFAVAVALAAGGNAGAADADTRTIAAAGEPNEGAQSDGHILVLENDETVAHAMTTLFDHWRLKHVLAPSYATLAEIARGRDLRPRAIIADYHLNGDIDGIEAIGRLRALFQRDLPGILITADQSQPLKERARAADIEYFSKPLKPAQLRAYLNHLAIDATRGAEGRLPSASSKTPR
jgi:two-component system, sensor histidine kinase